MAEDPKEGFVEIGKLGDERTEIAGQSTAEVRALYQFLLADVSALATKFSSAALGSALLSITVNYMLSQYTTESVADILTMVIPNLPAMKETIIEEWLASQDFGEPQ